MPTTVYPDSVRLETVKLKTSGSKTTPSDVLYSSVHGEVFNQCEQVLQSSFTSNSFQTSLNERFATIDLSTTRLVNPSIYASVKNGLLSTVINAYNRHHHLILRPDDIWIGILAQFSLFVNGNAERLRKFFVSHQGKKELKVKANGSLWEVDFGKMSIQMTEEIEKNVVDPELKDWLLPNFSTTTATDKIVSSILTMSTLRAYFEYTYDCSTCGLPAVTLLGEKKDWEQLWQKVEKLKQYGEETLEWYTLLKPIFARFVRTFEDPNAEEVKYFWQRVVRESVGGSGGGDYASGWISAFCFFGEKGNKVVQNFANGYSELYQVFQLELDGVRYPFVLYDNITASVADLPVKLVEDGLEYQGYLIAGIAGSIVGGSDLAIPESESDNKPYNKDEFNLPEPEPPRERSMKARLRALLRCGPDSEDGDDNADKRKIQKIPPTHHTEDTSLQPLICWWMCLQHQQIQ